MLVTSAVPSLCRPWVVALRVGSYGLVKACLRFMLVASLCIPGVVACVSEAMAWKVDVFVGGFCGALSMQTLGGGTARRKLWLGKGVSQVHAGGFSGLETACRRCLWMWSSSPGEVVK